MKQAKKSEKKGNIDLGEKRRLVTWSWKGFIVKGLCHGLGICQLKIL